MTSFVENHFMIINENGAYPIKEASELTGINARTLSRLAVKLGIEKIDNRYIFKGSDLTKYLEKTEVEVINYDEILEELDTTRTQNLKLSNKVKTLESSVKTLTQNNLELNQIIKEKDGVYSLKSNEVHKLKQKLVERTEFLKSDVPHQDKLKEAIRLITLEALDQGVTHKIFTEDQYIDIIGAITEVDVLRDRLEKQDETLKSLIKQVSERNFIEAKDKGHHKK